MIIYKKLIQSLYKKVVPRLTLPQEIANRWAISERVLLDKTSETRLAFAMIIYKKLIQSLYKKVVPRLGIEPRTQGFSVPCSTNWANAAHTIKFYMAFTFATFSIILAKNPKSRIIFSLGYKPIPLLGGILGMKFSIANFIPL